MVEADSIGQAELIKTDANRLFQNKEYSESIKLYTQAISLNPGNCIYYSNRSLAHYNLEAYGLALEDASKSIELDSTYSKAFFRRAQSYLALNKISNALTDLEELHKREPKNVEVIQKLEFCRRIQMKQAFERAFSSQSDTFDVWDLASLSNALLSDYKGPVFYSDDGKESDINIDDIEKTLQFFKDGNKTIPAYQIAKLVKEAYDFFKTQPNVVHFHGPDSSKSRRVTICGDVHGQYFDFINIFKINGMPSENNIYLFNGDFVDRGSWSLEIIVTLLLMKLAFKDSFFLNRGNHETHDMNIIYGFEREIATKYPGSSGKKLYDEFKLLFEALPLCHIIGKKIFITHGGIPSIGSVTIDQINKLDRFCQPPDSGIMCDLLWADPHPGTGLLPSDRGISYQFGSDITDLFLNTNDLKYIVRSHQMKTDGFEFIHNNKCLTIFSAPNYGDYCGNKGAIIRIGDDLEPEVLGFNEVPHPHTQTTRSNPFMQMPFN